MQFFELGHDHFLSKNCKSMAKIHILKCIIQHALSDAVFKPSIPVACVPMWSKIANGIRLPTKVNRALGDIRKLKGDTRSNSKNNSALKSLLTCHF